TWLSRAWWRAEEAVVTSYFLVPLVSNLHTHFTQENFQVVQALSYIGMIWSRVCSRMTRPRS
ncbi:MAG TPA: hypothetical protein PKE64_18420, partial [Anaerolineae bacterium]|nr:hypothetical protein [Anaerolineae bacterium]